ncbi:MAG: UMP kinase [Planctomycetota bacterium]
MSDAEADAPHPSPRYRRVLLKISGEAFCVEGGFGVDPEELKLIAHEIAEAAKVGATVDPDRLRRSGDNPMAGTQVAVVVGGGNIIRGAALAKEGLVEQAVADQMGMLGTVINALALKEALETLGQPARVMSALMVSSVAENFIRGRAIRHLEKGRVVIFAAGTGNPFSTTDSGASLRASEINADVVLKATKVDGIYDKDPNRHADAVRFETIGFDEAISRDLKVMDIGSFAQCRENDIPIVVFDMKTPGNIARVVAGEAIGTRVG